MRETKYMSGKTRQIITYREEKRCVERVDQASARTG